MPRLVSRLGRNSSKEGRMGGAGAMGRGMRMGMRRMKWWLGRGILQGRWFRGGICPSFFFFSLSLSPCLLVLGGMLT